MVSAVLLEMRILFVKGDRWSPFFIAIFLGLC